LAGNVIRIQNIKPNPEEPKVGVILYTQDFAKWRIQGPRADTPGFSMAALNSANIRTIGDTTIEADGGTLNPEELGDVGRVAMVVDGQKSFESDYETKATYDLVWANGTRRDDINVVNAVIPVRGAHRVPGFYTPYFQFQRSIYAPWLKDIAQDLIRLPLPLQLDETTITAERYFIATQFPIWSGGRIIHDPHFTAYSKPEGAPEPTTTEEPLTTSETSVVKEFPWALRLELLLPVLVGLSILRRRSKRCIPN